MTGQPKTHEYKTATVDFDKVAYWTNHYAAKGWRIVSIYKDAYSNTDQCFLLERPLFTDDGVKITWLTD